MGLNVTIQCSGAASGVIYALKAENVSHSLVRMAIQSPLPSTPGDDPNIFLLDLGMVKEEISVQGVVDSTGTTGTPPTLPSKTDLENVGRKWWNYGAGSPTDLILLTLSSGQAYYCSVKSFDFRWEGALEDRWQFTMTFLVAQKSGETWL